MAIRHRIRASRWKVGNYVRRRLGKEEIPLRWGNMTLMPTIKVRFSVDPRVLRRR